MANADSIKSRPSLLLLLRGGLLSLAVPLSFDAILSLLSQNVGSYAPPILYPVFFLLGVVAAYSGQRSKVKETSE